MDINDYPELKEALVLAINVHHNSLQHFHVCSLPPLEREMLKLAYIRDADVSEIDSAINGEWIAKELKRGISADIAMQDALFEKIYDIAQLMGPYLRELERVNNGEDRVNE